MRRPAPDEYNEFYASYIARVPEGDVVELMTHQIDATHVMLASATAEQSLHRYAPGKWSVREVVGHLVDTERVMAYRALCIARADPTPLPAFDEDAYVANADFDQTPLQMLLDDYVTQRRATVRLFTRVDDETSVRRGTASGHLITVRALAYIIAGHELHHRAILEERYGLKG